MTADAVCESLCPKKSCENTVARHLSVNDEDADVRMNLMTTVNVTNPQDPEKAVQRFGSDERSKSRVNSTARLRTIIADMEQR